MSEYDRLNLQFLLNASKDVIIDWYSKVSEDDHEYAAELLAMYGEELHVKTALLSDPEINDTSEVYSYLKGFML